MQEKKASGECKPADSSNRGLECRVHNSNLHTEIWMLIPQRRSEDWQFSVGAND
jgi:hypothetical protein